MKLSNFKHATITKRPSAHCKTPYVADIILDDGTVALAHCPALGCCGLSDKNSNVIVVPLESEKTKCQYRVELSVINKNIENETIVGINPKNAEYIMYEMLSRNECPFLNVKTYAREKKMLNSRFDFMGVEKDDTNFIMEIKNVPLADHVDVPKKERKKYNTENMPYNEKIAYFPDGYRKNSTAVVSPRALKHIEELEIIKKDDPKTRAILCFTVPRHDVNVFQPSNIDLTYKAAVQKAWLNGVEIHAVQVIWNNFGICQFVKCLPVVLFDTHGPHFMDK